MHQLTLYDLVAVTLRRFSILVLVLAALTAVEPLLHNHPLQQNAIPDACAVCANSVAPLPSVSPTIVAPQQIIACTIVSVAVTAVAGADSLTLVPRAPPAS